MHPGLARGTVGGNFEQFTCEIGKGELLGDEITGIVVAYDKAAASGSYTAYFDNILIETDFNTGIKSTFPKKIGNRIYVENNVLNFKDFASNTDVVIYSITGTAIKSFKINSNRVPVNLPTGIYIVATKSERSIYSQKIVIGR
jgi:hypothetical protein